MTKLESYLEDGANWQAKSVLAYLQHYLKVRTIDKYYNTPFYNKVDFQVGRFENCREQGYVLMINVKYRRIANYAFFEHRNSDSIVIFKSDANTINTPSIEEIFGERSKWDCDAGFSCGDIMGCGDWIIKDVSKIINAEYEKSEENE